jgi:hypothetical protein
LEEDGIQLILRKGQNLLVGEPEAGLLRFGHYVCGDTCSLGKCQWKNRWQQ